MQGQAAPRQPGQKLAAVLNFIVLLKLYCFIEIFSILKSSCIEEKYHVNEWHTRCLEENVKSTVLIIHVFFKLSSRPKYFYLMMESDNGY